MKKVYLAKVYTRPPVFRTTPEFYPPWNLICLSSILKDTGYDVALYHEDPGILISSLKNIEKNGIVFIEVPFNDYITPSINITKELHECRPDITKIWIGQFPSFFPEQCISESFIQFAVSGDFSVAVPAILENRYQHKEGIYYKNDQGKYFGHGVACSPDERMIEPDFDATDFHKYIYKGRDGSKFLQYESSSGCNFNCSFCLLSRPEYPKWLAYSADDVIRHIKTLKNKYDFNEIHFIDHNFLVNKERAFAIMEGLHEMGISIHALDTHLSMVDDEFIQQLIRLQVKEIFVGIESGNNRLLKMMNKKITRHLIMEKIGVLKKYPLIKTYGNIIYALPTETEEEFKDDIDFAIKLKAINPYLSMNFVCYRPYAGTGMFSLARECGYNPPSTLEGWKNHFILESSPSPTWVSWKAFPNHSDLLEIRRFSDIISFCKRSNVEGNLLIGLENILGSIFNKIAYQRLRHLYFDYRVDLLLFRFLTEVNFMIKKHIKI